MTDSAEKQFDVAIVGGGVIGCSIAWRLAQAGKKLVLIERAEPGKEASWAAGGILAPLAEADHADEFFELAVRSRAMYAKFARELREASGIDIEYRTEGTLYLALTEEDEAELEERWRWQHEAGLNVKRLNRDCTRKLEPSLNPNLRWALEFPDDHQVNNRRLAAALATAARKAGAEFWTQAQATQVLTESQAGKTRVTGIQTDRWTAQAPVVILSAGAWSGGIGIDVMVSPVRGQMVALEMPASPIRHIIYSRRGYVIPRNEGFVISGSTTERVEFDKRVTGRGIHTILDHAIEIYPALADQAIIETWAGLRPRGLDSRPILGPDPKVAGLLHATAHYRNGILLTPITAEVLSSIILKGESPISLTAFGVDRHRLA
jgi:glycine oxidase